MARRPSSAYSLIAELFASPTDPMPKASRNHTLMRVYSGLRSLERDADPSVDDWKAINEAAFLMETLVTMGICADSGLLSEATIALTLAGCRKIEGKPLRLDAHGIQAVRGLLEDYKTVLEALPHRTMVQCHRATEKRLQAEKP